MTENAKLLKNDEKKCWEGTLELIPYEIIVPRSNLKNLSGVLNLSHGSNMVGST